MSVFEGDVVLVNDPIYCLEIELLSREFLGCIYRYTFDGLGPPAKIEMLKPEPLDEYGRTSR